MTSREDLLNQYIDARIAGERVDAAGADDPELRELLEIVDQVHAGGEIEWPEGDFPGRLSRGLRTELKPLGAPLAVDDEMDTDGATAGPGAASRSAGEDEPERRRGWRWYTRQFAGMAAAAAVIGLFALGLAFILGDWGGEVRAPGAVVVPGEVPGTLLYTEYDGGEQTIARIDADGTDQQDLASRWSPTYEVSDLAWSPDGEWIAYFDPEDPDRDAAAGISLVRSDGSETESIDAGPVHGTLRLDTQLNWSYNGNSLAFAHQLEEHERMRVSIAHPEADDIQVIESDLDPTTHNDSHPAWAPDRWALAFSRNEGEDQRSIQLLREGMSEPISLVENRPRANQPAWSPDGESIVYIDSTRDGERSSIYVVDVESRDVERVTDHERWDYAPAWSSRDQIAFMSDHGDRNYDIFLVDPDGSDLRNITEDYDWPVYLPNWSDDGRYLSFTSHNQDQNRWRINVYDVETDQLYTVLESEDPLFAAQWQPDGSADDRSDRPDSADVDGAEWSDEQIDLMRQGVEQYLAEDDPIALTVNGEEITAGQIDMQRATAELSRTTTRELIEDSDALPPEVVEYYEALLALTEEYGPANVGLGNSLAQAAIQIYAEENDLVASEEQIDEAMEQQRESWEMIEEEDPESATAVGEAMIDVMGEDVYWNEYLPEAITDSLTEQNVEEAVWEAADVSADDDPSTGRWERDAFLAGLRADLVQDADIEIIDEVALGDADLERAIEYVTEAYPDLLRDRNGQRTDSG